jgi:hypothetical protein
MNSKKATSTGLAIALFLGLTTNLAGCEIGNTEGGEGGEGGEGVSTEQPVKDTENNDEGGEGGEGN